MKLPINEIICGAMPEATKGFPNGLVNCSISSPPYWALRDYGTATWEGGNPDCDHKKGKPKWRSRDKSTIGYAESQGHNLESWGDICRKCGAKRTDKQLGLESTFEEYIDKLCTIYDEVKRVLRDDGTCWVNLGDTYAGSTQGGGDQSKRCDGGKVRIREQRESQGYLKTPLCGLQQKCLCLIPQRFAIEMVNRGWILRNCIIWHKPNPMPSSAKDRFTVDFEYVYFFVKSRKYWFEPQYEPMEGKPHAPGNKPREGIINYQTSPDQDPDRIWGNPLGRNKRTVWTIPTQPFPEAHFATFPEKLVEPMIKAGCPEFVCTKCGKAREKIWENIKVPDRKGRSLADRYETDRGDSKQHSQKYIVENNHIGYTDCGCNAEFRPGIVWDIFAGSGTTLQVAARLRRDWIGVELKPEYIEMAEKRARQGETGLSVKEQKQGQQPLFPVETK